MFCKACGAELGQHDKVCQRCGTRVVALEGGVGFWDLREGDSGSATVSASIPASQIPPAPIANPADAPGTIVGDNGRSNEPALVANRPRKMTSMLLFVACFACILALSVALWWMKARIDAQDKQITELLGTSGASASEQIDAMSLQIQEVNNRIADHDERIHALELALRISDAIPGSAINGSDPTSDGTYQQDQTTDSSNDDDKGLPMPNGDSTVIGADGGNPESSGNE